ncbi:hypothetical protein PV325_008979, partial [Microctonus aethiopoides]
MVPDINNQFGHMDRTPFELMISKRMRLNDDKQLNQLIEEERFKISSEEHAEEKSTLIIRSVLFGVALRTIFSRLLGPGNCAYLTDVDDSSIVVSGFSLTSMAFLLTSKSLCQDMDKGRYYIYDDNGQ